MGGKHFCVPFTDKRDTETCFRIGQSVMFDNGAFSFFTRGEKLNWEKFYDWIEPYIGHPHWSVVPDVIGGTPEENIALAKEYPFRKDCACAVWHMDEPIGQVFKLMDMGFGKIAFGSSGKYWQVGSNSWCMRADEVWNALGKNGDLPWVHMMRGLSLGGKQWPFSSADSTNVAVCGASVNREYIARQIDAAQTPVKWVQRGEQTSLWEN